MSRHLPRSAAATLVALALLALGAGSDLRPAAATSRGAAPAAVAAAQPGRPVLQGLGSCIGTSGRLLVLLLIDESASLVQTDPHNQRVTAAKAALASLEDLGWLVPSRRPTVEVQLAGFSDDFHPVGGWTRVGPGNLSRLQAHVDGFAIRNRGIDTDFANALLGARRSLAARSAELSHNDALEPCQALLLFTDGNYDLEPRNVDKGYAPRLSLVSPGNAAKVVAAGRRLICRPGGVADQLRDDGVTVVAVALTTRISRTDQRFLQSVATGKAGATTCGRDGLPAAGVYLPARDLFGLLLAFDGIVNRNLREGTPLPDPGPTTPCERVACPSGTRTFRVEPGLRGFHLLADLAGEGIEVELRSPGARAPLVLDRLRPGAARIGSARADYRWLSPSALTVDVSLPRTHRDWAGTWSVTFIDRTGTGPDRAVGSRIYLYGDLRPALVGSPEWRLGEPGPVAARVVDADGHLLKTPDLVRSAELSAEVTDPATGARTPVTLAAPGKDGVARGVWAVPASLQAPSVDLTLWLTVTTRSGLAMAPVSETYRMPVKRPGSYPTVGPAELRLPRVVGSGTAHGTITLTGGTRGTGCVWFDAPSFTALPDGVGRVTASFAPDATSQGRCIRLAAGERREVQMSATPEGTGDGMVRGQLVVNVTSSTDTRRLSIKVPTSFRVVPPPPPRFKWLLFLLILLAGTALPVAAMAALNLLLAKFEPTDLLRAARVPVLVDGDDVWRRARDGRGEPLGELRPEEFGNVAAGSSSRLRSLSLDGLELRARAPRLPIRAPYGEAVADGRLVTASEGTATTRAAVCGRLPLELGGTWVFVLDEPPAGEDGGDGDRVAGTLHAFLDEPLDDKGADLAEVVRRDLPAAAHQLASLAAERRPVDADGTGAGPGPEPEPVPTPGRRGPDYGDASAGDPGRPPPPPPTY